MDAAAPERHTRAALVGSGAVTTGIKDRGNARRTAGHGVSVTLNGPHLRRKIKCCEKFAVSAFWEQRVKTSR